MAYFKCSECRIRLDANGPATAAGASTCPECGAGLTPVGALSEIVGYRWVEHGPDPRSGHAALADAIALTLPKPPLHS